VTHFPILFDEGEAVAVAVAATAATFRASPVVMTTRTASTSSKTLVARVLSAKAEDGARVRVRVR
jgi:hypothetical protein